MTDYAFLHGGAQGSWVWDETIAALTSQTGGAFGRALALDVPGCGIKRGRDTSALSMDDVVRELLGDLDAAGMTDVVLVGHSQAGMVLPRMAELRPELFRRLVYVSCSAPTPGQNVMRMMGTGLQGANENEVGWPFDRDRHSMRERYAAMFCNDMSAEEAAALLSKLGNDAWPNSTYEISDWRYDHLANVRSSYVMCLQDCVLPAIWQQKFAERLKVQRTIRVDAGHQVMNSRPNTLAEVLRREAQLS